MEGFFFFFNSILKTRQEVVLSSQMPHLFLFAGVSKPVCAAELWQAICVGIISVWSCVFAKACRCLCFTVQLLKAAWILTSCSGEKESMKKCSPWLVLPPVGRWAGRLSVTWEFHFWAILEIQRRSVGARSCYFGEGSWCHLGVATPAGAQPEVSSAPAWLNRGRGSDGPQPQRFLLSGKPLEEELLLGDHSRVQKQSVKCCVSGKWKIHLILVYCWKIRVLWLWDLWRYWSMWIGQFIFTSILLGSLQTQWDLAVPKYVWITFSPQA